MSKSALKNKKKREAKARAQQQQQQQQTHHHHGAMVSDINCVIIWMYILFAFNLGVLPSAGAYRNLSREP